jgi:8-hydroxy-5-deazaflavin:NADPH oxidoreductase
MPTISIIGSGNMASAIGTRAAKHGHTIEIMSRNTAKAQALADQIGNGATVGTYGARPAGDIVIVAILFAGAVEVVAHYARSSSTSPTRSTPTSADSCLPRTTRSPNRLPPPPPAAHTS